MGVKSKKPLGHTIWFKIVLTVLFFLPSYTAKPYNPANTTSVISEVLAHPLVATYAWILPITKALLFVALLAPFVSDRIGQTFVLRYYVSILFIVGLMQNMSFTRDYGFTWLIGNTLVQFVVLVVSLVDVIQNRTMIAKHNLERSRLWVIAPMILAFLMPYAVNKAGVVQPSVAVSTLFNESGVTYCMITPVVIGVLLLYSRGVYKPTLSIISYVGLIFGILNMLTWFGMQPENWWMGVLHLPLVVLSFYGLLIAYKERTLSY